MAHINFAPVIYKQYWRKGGYYIVRMRLTVGRKQKFLTTDIVAYPYQLTRSLAIKDTNLQGRLLKLEQRMRDALSDIDMFDLDVMTIDEIVNHINMRINGDFRLDFFKFWQQALATKSEGSRVNYTAALHSFQNFIGYDTLDISKVTARLMRGYESWLVEKYGKGARAVSMYTAAVKHIHSLARKKYNDDEFGEVLIRNPFEFYNPPKWQTKKGHRDVDASIIQQMIDTREQLTGVERRAVDAFLLSFALMGMNAPDLLTCKPPKKGIIIYNRQKTKNLRPDRAEMHVRIEPCITPIYNMWAESDGRHAFTFHSFHVNYRQFNWALAKGLQAYRKRIGFPDDETLDFYSARHTWSSIAYRVGINEGVVNDCLCHVDPNMRITNIYINKDWSVMWEANAKVLAKFNWH